MKPRNKILIILTILFSWSYYKYKFQCEADRNYFSKLNLHLTGKVVLIDRESRYNGFNIILVKIIHSNIDSYDPRGKLDSYYCIIKNGFAELYQPASECSIGDIVEVDSKKELFTIRKPAGNIEMDMLINDDERYYEFLKKNHQKF